MADLKISALNSLAGADLVAADVVAVVDDSASETKKLTVSDLIANGSTLISDNTIPSAKILFSAGSIDTAELAASAVETAKINDSAVTAAKLADNSSVTLVSTLPASGDFTGQIALDTDDDKIYVWDGSAWDSVKGAGSINVVNGSTTGEINIVASTSGDTVTISATLDDTTAAAQFLGGPTGAGGTVGYRALVGTDLPTATTTAKGGVIVNGNGLTMSSDTIAIDNTVTAETTENHIVQYDANGLVTGGRAIIAGDVPTATSTTVGVAKPGSGLGVTGAGELNHNNAVTAGTAAKVTFDTEGHITGTESLLATDIPDLDADKVTSGAFPTARIATDAITADKLANYTVAQISETTPTADFTSQFFFNPITRDLFLWDGNVFQPVGISAGEIVLAGTYDASTNLLDSVTADGTAAGFTNGASLPAAAAGNNRHYVVVSQSGTGSAPAPTVTLEPPDILLSNGTSYVLIETSETITAQIASNVGFTPTGNIAGTNVQAAVAEVDSEKLAKGGDTMTGDLTLNNVNIVFEGATENEYETTLTVTDPTADRTLTLPNNTGNLVSTGDTGTVTSAMIADGTIVNADISSTAEIAVSKLANGTARQLLQTDVAGSGVEFTSNIDVPGTLDVTGAATLDSTLGVTGLISADGKVKFPAGSASAPSFYSGTDTNTGLYFSAADEVSITTGGTQRVVFDSSGNVGIGASNNSSYDSTAQNLLVADESGNTGITVRSGGGTPFGAIHFADGTGSNAEKRAGRILYGHSGDFMSFHTANAEAVRIDSSGRVGIGSTSPSESLEVAGNGLKVSGQTSGVTDEGITFDWDSGNNNGRIFSESAGSSNLLFYTTSSGTRGERMRIDSSGNVGIGTSSPNNYSNFNTLTLNGTTGGVVDFESNGTLMGQIYCETDIFRIDARGSTTPLKFVTNSAERMRIDQHGRVGINNTSPNSQFHNDLVIGTGSGSDAGLTIHTSTSGRGSIAFSDGISGTSRYDGYLQYDHSNQSFKIYTNGGNERLRVDSSGNVGIGTTSTSARLTVTNNSGTGNINLADFTSSSASQNALLRIISRNAANSGTTSVDLYKVYQGGFRLINNDTASSNYTSLEVGGSERLRVDSSGRLLHGTSSASSGAFGTVPFFHSASSGSTNVFQNFGNTTFPARIDLCKTRGTSANSHVVVQNNDTAGGIFFSGSDGTDYAQVAQIEAFVDGTPGNNDMPGRLVLSTTADGAQYATERMRIDSSGNVKINTTHGGAKLNVYPPSTPSTSGLWSHCSIGIGNSTTIGHLSQIGLGYFNVGSYASSYIGFVSTNQGSYGYGDLVFGTRSVNTDSQPTERMRITSGGILCVNRTTAVHGGQLSLDYTNGTTAGLAIKDTQTSGTGVPMQVVNGSGTIVGSISQNQSSTSFNTTSDYRLKENVIDVTDGITRVKQLQPKRFNFIADDSKTVDGFLAHEAATVVPEAVTGTHNEVDDDNNPVYQGIDQSKLVPLLTAALQEAIAKIETLEAKVAALEAG